MIYAFTASASTGLLDLFYLIKGIFNLKNKQFSVSFPSYSLGRLLFPEYFASNLQKKLKNRRLPAPGGNCHNFSFVSDVFDVFNISSVKICLFFFGHFEDSNPS